MLIRSHTTTLVEIFCKLLLTSQVNYKSMRVADDNFQMNSACEWVNNLCIQELKQSRYKAGYSFEGCYFGAIIGRAKIVKIAKIKCL